MEREDRARIYLKLDEMMQYIEELKEILPDEEEYLHDLKSRKASEKTI